MKVLRILFVMVFVSGLLIAPAQAQGEAEYGFLPLVTQANPAIPLAFQVRQAFNHLLPELLAAQRSGAIQGFQPDLSAGILMLRYAAGGRATLPAVLQGTDNINTAVARVPQQKIHATAAPGTAITPIFKFYLYSGCFYGNDLGANSHIVAVLRDQSGRALTTYIGDADVTGYVSACFNYYAPLAYVAPGYKISINVYDPSAVILGTYSVTVPKIAYTSYNSSTSVIAGSGSKNKTYTIFWEHPDLNAIRSYTISTKTGTIPATGKWKVDMGNTKFRGGDYFQMELYPTPEFVFGYTFNIPFVYCKAGGNYCYLEGFAQKPASLKITHAGVTHTFKGTFDYSGWFGAELLDASGAPIFLKAGDKIVGSGVAGPLTLPKLSAVPNFTTSVVSGKAPAGRYFMTWLEDVTTSNWYEQWVGASAAGTYSADFSSSTTLTSGAPYVLEVDYVDKVSGNESDLYVTIAP